MIRVGKYPAHFGFVMCADKSQAIPTQSEEWCRATESIVGGGVLLGTLIRGRVGQPFPGSESACSLVFDGKGLGGCAHTTGTFATTSSE